MVLVRELDRLRHVLQSLCRSWQAHARAESLGSPPAPRCQFSRWRPSGLGHKRGLNRPKRAKRLWSLRLASWPANQSLPLGYERRAAQLLSQIVLIGAGPCAFSDS